MEGPTKRLIYIEAYIVKTSEMEGVYVIPRDTISIKNELQQVIHLVGKSGLLIILNKIPHINIPVELFLG